MESQGTRGCRFRPSNHEKSVKKNQDDLSIFAPRLSSSAWRVEVPSSAVEVHRPGGFIGALVGFWISRQLKLPEPFVLQVGDTPFPVVWSIAGSALFVGVISLLTRGRR